MLCARCATTQSGRTIALLGLCLAVAGCLPAGGPPTGQQVLADRTIAGVFLTASGLPDAPPNLFVLGAARPLGPSGSNGADLYALPYASMSEAVQGFGQLAPTVAGVILGDGVEPSAYIPGTDSQGRLIFLTPAQDAPDGDPIVARFDFVTGQKEDLAPPIAGNPGFLLSASRARVLAGTSVFEQGGRAELGTPSVTTPAFVGEDLYYGCPLKSGVLAGGSSINRSRPGTAPQTLLSSSGTLKFTPFASDLGTQLLISTAANTSDVPYLIFSTALLLNTSIPLGKGWAQFHSISSDGHWLLFREPLAEGDHRLFAFDWTTGYSVSLSSNKRPIGATNEWRPGRHELWSGLGPTGSSVWNPEMGYTRESLQQSPVQIAFLSDGRTSMFTRDGNYWLSVEYSVAGDVVEPTFYLRSAEDLTAPGQPLNVRGQELYPVWETSEGRLLVGVGSFGENRQDIYLVDPAAGTSRAIASAGRVLALGSTRVLALVNWQVSTATGDLTLVDLATGEKTTLAQDVYAVAIDRATSAVLDPGADRLAPGTVIAFLVRNRLDSPYDGLWVAHLP
jgi:hypothetical protein